MYPFELLFRWVIQWSHDRNIIFGTRPEDQLDKAYEEMQELEAGIEKQDVDEIRDGIGDVLVCLTNIAEQNGLTMNECLSTAWHEIRDRKGKIVNGKFVKEADLAKLSRH